MIKALKARLSQGYRTGAFPAKPPILPERFRGLPEFHPEHCTDELAGICPTGALREEKGRKVLDLGGCIFCGKCEKHSPDAVRFQKEYRMGAFERGDLLLDGVNPGPVAHRERRSPAADLCGRSLKIRQVSAGGCGACELDFNVLNTLAWDMGRFSIGVAASPRHADALLVTGPISVNMLLALKKTKAAMAKPCFVIACGSCAISGGIYAESPETLNGVEAVCAVDLFVPGCPPHPTTLLEALLRFMGRDLPGLD